MLTLCPYLVKPISDLANVNDEHIIPSAMGGSDHFVLRADQSINSNFGSTIDSDLVHDPWMRFMAATQGIKSRSGDVSISIEGDVVGSNLKVKVPFSHRGMGRPEIVSGNRYVKDPETGNLTGIIGFDHQIDEDLARLGLVKRKKKWEVQGRSRTDNPFIRLDFKTDAFKVTLGITKIAYLMACRTIGDAFVVSPQGERFRKAIEAGSWEQFDATNLGYLGAAEFALIYPPTIEPHQHLVACWGARQFIFIVVKLFGCIAQSVYVIPSAGLPLKWWEGSVVTNDALTGRMVEQTANEAMPVPEMIQRAIAYHHKTGNHSPYDPPA